jgi:hypothetical protein
MASRAHLSYCHATQGSLKELLLEREIYFRNKRSKSRLKIKVFKILSYQVVIQEYFEL